MSPHPSRRPGAVLAGAVALAPALLAAQLPNASPAAFGMAESFLAAARGADAVAWNPANLALPGNPSVSVRALAGGGVSALAPVSWSDVAGYGDRALSRDVRQQWLDRVTADGGQSGDADGGMTFLAVAAGRVGLQVSASGYARARMSPDAVEAVLFGNAGRTGTARDLRLAGSEARGGGFVTSALSYAHPVRTAAGALAIGMAAKYVVGGAMVRAADAGSAITTTDVAVAFPAVHSASAGGASGSGIGVDLGAAWAAGRLTLGARVENVVNTFAWDETRLRFRPGTASFDGVASASDFDERPYAQAPQALRDAVADERFALALAGGVAFRRSATLLLTADARHALGGDETIAIGPRSRVGVGVESRALGWLPLRAGAAVVSGGWQAAAGAGVRVGAYELSAAYMVRQGERGTAPGGMLNVVSVR